MAQDAMQIKQKILSILRARGPSLPVHVTKETGLSILFASAFLSELLSEKTIKMSHMKVGNSPVYFIPGNEYRLERFSEHLKNKEKEAFNLLREKKFLSDKEQEPAIRVALKAIKDFAIPFKPKNQNEIFWRYFTANENEFDIEIQEKQREILEEKPKEILEKEKLEFKEIKPIEIIEEKIPLIAPLKTSEPEIREKEKPLEIFDKKPKISKSKKPKKAVKKKKIPQKRNEKLFDKTKEFLTRKNIEIIGIENFSKNELILKVKENRVEKIIIVYNKKKITETDIINARKKTSNTALPYIILSLSEPSKKLQSLIESIKNLSEIKKLE